MALVSRDNLRIIYRSQSYELYIKLDCKYRSLYLKRNITRSRLSNISIKRAAKLFNLDREYIEERIKVK